MLSAMILVFFFIFYIAAQFSGSGKVLNKTFGLDPLWGVIIGSVVVIVYCVMGGFIAVVVTDVFQAILMILTLVAFPVIAFFVAAENNLHIIQSLESAGNEYLSLTRGTTGTTAVILVMSGLSWMLGYTGQPQLLTRMMAIRNKKDVRNAQWIASIWTLLAYIGAILIGLFGIVFVKNGMLGSDAAKLAADSEKILPVMVVTLVNPILAGILLSGVISAMMSTASSEVTVSSASITEDIYSNLKKADSFTEASSLYQPGGDPSRWHCSDHPCIDHAGYCLQPGFLCLVGDWFLIRPCSVINALLEKILTCRSICLPDLRNGINGHLEKLFRSIYRSL